MGRPDKDLFEPFQIFQLAIRPDHRRRAWIEIELPVVAVPLVRGPLIGSQAEGCHASPLRPQERRDPSFDHVSRLIDELIETDRLPSIRIPQGVPRLLGEDRGVDGSVPLVRVVVPLVGVVLLPEEDVGLGDSISDRGRVVPDGLGVGGVVTELDHERVVLRRHFLEAGRFGETVPKDPIGRVGDRLTSRGLEIASRQFVLREEPGCRPRLETRPGIPHPGGVVKQIPGMNRRACKVISDRLERDLVPLSGDGMIIALSVCHGTWSQERRGKETADEVAFHRVMHDLPFP